jgi:hypothetical protein
MKYQQQTLFELLFSGLISILSDIFMPGVFYEIYPLSILLTIVIASFAKAFSTLT